MKRLAILIGGLLVLPAFAEVAPVFIEDESALEYADGMYDENGFLIIPDEEVADETKNVVQQTPAQISRAPVSATPVANRTTSTRAMPASSGATAASGRGSANGNSSRVVAARTTTTSSRGTASRGTTTSPRAGTATSTRATTSTAATRAAAARTTGGATRATTTAGGATVARTATSTGRTTAARTATATTARAATASGTGRVSVDSNRNVEPGYKGTATVTSIGTVDTTNKPLYNKSASTRRTPTIRMSSLNGISAETTAVSTMSLDDMDDLAELTDYCKAQYANCMDNYCNVLDDNQGRCSCSSNLKNYAKAEQALKTATEELQDVAQKIQYIGLTSREVETLFTETIAEETMRAKGTDNSQLQSSLNKIKNMIIDVKSGGATSSAGNDILGLNFDLSGLLEFSFDSTGFDLGTLFGTTNTNSVSNQRGEQLYKTAAARCKSSVLKACTARGVDASIITNAYDLEIDRECMAYERSLNDSNDQMLATVRNAKNVLQKARLMVAQQKNAYDMRGCINALDSCMQDEFVCGSDYENCLDPTGRYIVNGAIVVGSQPGHAIDPEYSYNVASVMTSDVCRVNLYRTWDMVPGTCNKHIASESGQTAPNYTSYPSDDQGNAWGSGIDDTLSKYIERTVTSSYPSKTSENMSLYLQNKIGYNQKDRNYGMCMSVLNKCQDYTYTRGTGTSAQYEPANQVVQQYLARVLVQIKAKQDEILANYAETCVSDVTSCLGQNGYPTEDPSDWEDDPHVYSTNTTKMNIAVNACRAQIVTCMSVNGYSIETPTPTEMNCWVQGLLYNTTTDECMWDNVHESKCSDNYEWCATQNACVPEGTCSPTPTYYNVNIDCGNGFYSNTSVHTGSKQVLAGNALDLNGLCSWTGHYITGWICNNVDIPSSSYTPAVSGTTCSPTWAENPAGSYSYSLTCGGKCNGKYSSGSKPAGATVQIPNCVAATGDTQTWTCSKPSSFENSLNGYTTFEMPSSDVVCTAQCTAGGGTQPSWVTVNLMNEKDSGPTTIATPTKFYIDKNGVCSELLQVVTNAQTCAGAILSFVTIPDPVVAGFDGFYYNDDLQIIKRDGSINSGNIDAFRNQINYSNVSNVNIVEKINYTPGGDDPESEPKGGLRYVTIDDKNGTRAPRTRLQAIANNFWVDTDGSTCQHIGVYIADPNQNTMVCSTPVDNIGWWMKLNSRSSGFYVTDADGEPILFAREDGTIVTENLSKLGNTDPDETLVATAKVFTSTDNGVAYVSFDENNNTWTAQYTPPSDAYYIYDNFTIDFYPNRPTMSGANTPTSVKYIQGVGYKNTYGGTVTTVPALTDSGYRMRGYYPGVKQSVSTDNQTGNVWPAGGSLNNKKWVLITTDPNFSVLKLYAAWAKKCETIENGTCNLEIGSNGAVSYNVNCMSGYEQYGNGANAICIVPGSNWNDVNLTGASF